MPDNDDNSARGASAYDTLSRSQLIALLKKRDAERRLGLVWERDEIDPDNAIDRNFVIAELLDDLCERPAPWDNLIIEGDNYDALRWLRMTHRGQVKCIYIDPPYNTGNKDWVYNDNYVDANHRFRNSQWLEFLYQRLVIARDLLSPDGVLLCSINDDNRAILELMMEKALPGMKIGSFVWRTRAGTSGDGPFLSQDNEHILIFGNSQFRFGGASPDVDKYKNPDGDPRGNWTSVALQTNKNRIERPNSYFPVQNPRTKHWHPCNPNRTWAFQLRQANRSRGASFEDLFEADLLLFSKEEEFQVFDTLAELRVAIEQGIAHPYLQSDLPDLEFWVGKRIGLGTIRKKQFLKDLRQSTKPVSSWIDTLSASSNEDTVEVLKSGMTAEGSKAVLGLFGHKAFNYPKPVSLIRELVRQSTGPGDIVLDFFAGSATTAQAVMELSADDEEDRKFIMVSSTEATEDNPEKNLCRDVTAKRVRLLNSNNDKYEDLSSGFAYLKCKELDPLTLDDDLTAAAAWSILEAHHGLPLTVWENGETFSVHEGEGLTLILIDRWSDDVRDALLPVIARATDCFVYAFAPGQLSGLPSEANFEVRSVRDTLNRLYAA